MTDTRPVVLKAEHLGITFGGLKAVSDFNMEIHEGELMGLIGPNGAGKTTVFNLLTGVYVPTEGAFYLCGQKLNGKQTYQVVEAGIARTFQNIRLFKKMTVLENVMTGFHSVSKNGIFNIIYDPKSTRREEEENRKKALEILEFLHLTEIKDTRAGDIPYGTQRLLEIGRALATDPKLLLLDEPAAGMNSAEKKALVQTIRRIRDAFDLAVLLVEHDMELVMDVSEDITVVNFGRRIARGTAAEVQANEDVIEAYLGRSDD